MVAPVVRTAPDGECELTMMRWGFPPPMNAEASLVTNVRNTSSHWWKSWLQAGHRCLVPVNSFCEWTDSRSKVAVYQRLLLSHQFLPVSLGFPFPAPSEFSLP